MIKKNSLNRNAAVQKSRFKKTANGRSNVLFFRNQRGDIRFMRLFKSLSKKQLIVFALVFGLLGSYLIFRSLAATVLTVVEAETMTVTSGSYVAPYTDSTASASKALSYWTNGAASKQFSISSSATSLVVRAKSDICPEVASPNMEVRIDGILHTRPVTSSSWSDYTINMNLASGNHVIEVKFTNDYYRAGTSGGVGGDSGDAPCDSNLRVDKITFYGADGGNNTATVIEKARGKTSSASSQEGAGYEPYRGNDGTASTRWASAQTNNQWWRVDLGTSTPVSRVDINWETAYGSHYYLEGSNDGVNYFRLADVYNNRAGIKSSSFTEANARYVRMYGLTRGTPWGFSFWEVQVYGRSTTTTPSSVTAAITTPKTNTVVGGSIAVEASASATTGVSKVEFYVDGTLKATDTTAPYCIPNSSVNPWCLWDSRSVANGGHTITAYAYDTSGAKSAPSTINITVNNTVAQVGVYEGPADVIGHDQFSAWLGKEAYYAVDFLNDAESWDQIANSTWLFGPWSNWVKAKSGRRMVISTPMLNQASANKLGNCASTDPSVNYDRYFRKLSENLVAYGLGNSVIRLGWEANGYWYPWKASTNQAEWKACYRKIVGVMRSVPGQSFSFNLTYSLGYQNNGVTFESMYPGNDVVDSVGIDVYDSWWDANATADERWKGLTGQTMGLNEFQTFATSTNIKKPMSVPEWALVPRAKNGFGDNPTFIKGMADWIATNNSNLVFQSYFNHNSDWTGDHRLSTYPSSQSTFKTRFGQ